ncbi:MULTISPECIES: ADP-dependent glucokinase/phosphofructokinase [Natronorubrum]|uniref:Uncharacterized protein n=1 Tax=Natronorubrum bangense TaxID=61858 RepID=A0A4D6HRP5_9EURY|nr:hypothetical protein DV706_01465 [Natronorubrum bangense]QCC56038.1 hypothetical protein DV706_15805 [Natronorubrum bangense]
MGHCLRLITISPLSTSTRRPTTASSCTPAVVACPNRVVDDPAGTVGIGDIVSSSSFLLERELRTVQCVCQSVQLLL